MPFRSNKSPPPARQALYEKKAATRAAFLVAIITRRVAARRRNYAGVSLFFLVFLACDFLPLFFVDFFAFLVAFGLSALD